MKAYIAIKYHPDNRNRTDIERLSSALEPHGIDTMCIVRDLEKWGQVHFSPEELMHRSFEEIDACDVVIIDLTEKGVGIGIEAGYAWARHKPIITLARKGADISTTLQGISQHVFWYEDVADLTTFFAQLGQSKGSR